MTAAPAPSSPVVAASSRMRTRPSVPAPRGLRQPLASGRPGRQLHGIVTGVTPWEYALLRTQYHPPGTWTCTWICPDGRQIVTEEAELSALNRAGADGWELVGRSEALGGQLSH